MGKKISIEIIIFFNFKELELKNKVWAPRPRNSPTFSAAGVVMLQTCRM